MHLQSILSATALLLCSTLAATAEIVAREATTTPAAAILTSFNIPTTLVTGATATSLASALISAQSSLATAGAVKSAASFLAAHLPSSDLDSLTKNGYPHITPTAPPAWFTGLPSGVRSELLSEQSVMDAVVTKVLHLKGSGTGNVAAARATPAREVVGAGIGLVGVMGLMALL